MKPHKATLRLFKGKTGIWEVQRWSNNGQKWMTTYIYTYKSKEYAENMLNRYSLTLKQDGFTVTVLPAGG